MIDYDDEEVSWRLTSCRDGIPFSNHSLHQIMSIIVLTPVPAPTITSPPAFPITPGILIVVDHPQAKSPDDIINLLPMYVIKSDIDALDPKADLDKLSQPPSQQ